jgi:putative component of toxin-antitoxin plasmid stabilization module
LEVFEADNGSVPYERFVARLSDFKFAALDAAVTRVLVVRGLDLARTEWLKPLGEGLHEFRVRHGAEEITRMFGSSVVSGGGAPEAVLLRLFVHFHGARVILLLGGYDKSGDPTERRQQREIREARRLLTQFQERQKRERARARKRKG